MGWESVRTTLLISTGPGLFIGLMMLNDEAIDKINARMIIGFTIIWVITLIIHTVSQLRGVQ